MILLVTGGRTFCEATPDKSREQFMAERMALGFALDYIKPSSVIVGDASGADRWAKIWCDRRGVKLSTGRPDAAIVFPGGRRPNGIPIYEAAIR